MPWNDAAISEVDALSLYGIAIPILQLGFELPLISNGGSYYFTAWMLLWS